MKKKIRVALLFGGKSAEHEVSIRSAKNIAEAIDKEKYEVSLIGIDKSGKWLSHKSSQLLLGPQHPSQSQKTSTSLAAKPDETLVKTNYSPLASVDVVFPVLHGPFGEDGTVQGLLKLANIPFVGAGVLGSAIGMDKDVMKRLLKEAGIPVARWITVHDGETLRFRSVAEELRLPVFIKPANLGSSVGVSKARNEEEFMKALQTAFQFDRKVLIEEYIKCREIECSVLGNDEPVASVPGEVEVHHDFYSYEAKYLDENGASLEIPAQISEHTTKLIQNLAVHAYKVLSCEGMGRVDFFLKENGTVLVNEINTIPGFTNISMYPKLWEASGISYTELIDKLIQLAIERHSKEQHLKVSLQ